MLDGRARFVWNTTTHHWYATAGLEARVYPLFVAATSTVSPRRRQYTDGFSGGGGGDDNDDVG